VGNPLNVVYEFVAWVLKHIYGVLSPAFGPSSGWTWALSIVILVVLMRLILVPLFIKQMHTTRAMTALAPEMSALRKKYKDDKQTLNQEMMKLYQQAGVNPLMGCLPVVLQLPLFFALFSVLRAIAEWKPGQAPKYGLTHQMVQSAQQAKILGAGIGDKVLFTDGMHVPLHAKFVILVAVIISMTTTYLTIRQSMKRGMMPTAPDNPMGQTSKMMQYFMPLFALSGLYWQFGLVLYWVTTNVWTLGQQYVLFRRYPQPRAAGTATATAGGTATAPTLIGRGGAARRSASTQAGSNGGEARRGGTAARAGTQAVRDGRGSGSTRSSSGAQRQAKTDEPAAAANGGGILRKLGARRAEPEPPPPEPEVKIVRQQRQRQTRSKRTGKR
jgi:YidC/Oxa1 family membrane protein insertase